MGLVQRCARPMVVHNEIIEKELEAVEGTQYVTRESILRRAQEIKGIPLRDVDKTGRLATGKGAIGTVIEESWFGYTPNSESEPDFPEAGVELKVTPYLRGKNGIRAKERLVCNIINYMEEYDKTFQTSAFWHKCNTMLLMSYEHLADKPKGDFRIDEAVLFSFPDEDLAIIEHDWKTIMEKVRAGRAHELSEGDTLYLAACTKGANASSVRQQPFSELPAKQRAYSLKSSYMTQILNKYIFGNAESPRIIKSADVLHAKTFEDYISVVGSEKIDVVRPYLSIKNATKQTGEIYFEITSDSSVAEIQRYNDQLDQWERKQGYQIKLSGGFSCIESYEQTTLFILRKLLDFSSSGSKGQREYNQKFLKESSLDFADDLKKQALRDVFANSRLLLIYGAAGTGKTTLINYISNLMANQRKLFLTKTHTALQNLKRRIDNPGTNSDFISIDSFTKQVNLPDYDVIFVDECSTIDNRTMGRFLSKMSPDTFLVLAGDIHQIESIEFGNWFFYAKDIIKTPGANVELLSTWRTQDQALISLWNEVRTRADMITEKLVINGPYSEDIGPNVFKRECEDEVILCLNYDGKFGLNNMNNYFQAANTKGEAIPWAEWSYKVGDPILFNDSKRFDLLYNNLKGRIVDIEKHSGSISFTVDVEIPLTELMCKRDGIEFIESIENGTRIRFAVYEYDESKKGEDLDENLRLKSVVPFQLAYAVSIHKAQGLEYDSVKVIIPSNNAEKITHGIFYTAITRAKTNLKIYWSSETMHDVVKGFATDESKRKSLEIVKTKLGKN